MSLLSLQHISAILDENKDMYMLNPCSASIWFVVELCEPIQVGWGGFCPRTLVLFLLMRFLQFTTVSNLPICLVRKLGKSCWPLPTAKRAGGLPKATQRLLGSLAMAPLWSGTCGTQRLVKKPARGASRPSKAAASQRGNAGFNGCIFLKKDLPKCWTTFEPVTQRASREVLQDYWILWIFFSFYKIYTCVLTFTPAKAEPTRSAGAWRSSLPTFARRFEDRLFAHNRSDSCNSPTSSFSHRRRNASRSRSANGTRRANGGPWALSRPGTRGPCRPLCRLARSWCLRNMSRWVRMRGRWGDECQGKISPTFNLCCV